MRNLRFEALNNNNDPVVYDAYHCPLGTLVVTYGPVSLVKYLLCHFPGHEEFVWVSPYGQLTHDAFAEKMRQHVHKHKNFPKMMWCTKPGENPYLDW